MKIYISTPVNGRSEATYPLKRSAAKLRACEIESMMRKQYPQAQIYSFADIVPHYCSEAGAMGRCIHCLIECNAIVMDLGHEYSRGCSIELFTANAYGKKAYRVTEDNTIESL